MTHLTERDINGYIHRSLTDAQRETMDRHIQDCPDCRTHVQAAEQLRRQMAYTLADDLRHSRPSKQMRYNQVRPRLKRQRRWASFRLHAMQVLSAAGTAAAVLALIYFGFYLLQTAFLSRPGPISSQWVGVEALDDIVPIFDEAWDDTIPYRDGLITEQQEALTLLSRAPVYHMDVSVSEDLQWVNGRQQLRFVNITGQPLDALYFHLYPNRTYGLLTVYDVEVNGRPVEPELLDDELNVRVRLPHTLQPDEIVVVEMAFEMSAGRTWSAATGSRQPQREALHLVQFNPTLAVYDQEQGWDLSPAPHNLSPNSWPGFYRARVKTAASQHVIGSGTVTGQDMVHDQDNSQQIITLAAGPVDEFYLTISEQFQVSVSEMVGETRLTSYAYSAAELAGARKSLEYARAALLLYNQLFGPYPFTELDLINVPSLTFARQGAAYSGVVLLEQNPTRYTVQEKEHVILFQLATLWFDPVIARSRLENPWLADGLAEYATWYFYDIYFSDKAVDEMYQRWQRRYTPGQPRLGQPASSYGELTYFNVTRGQTPLFLHSLAQAMGQTTFNGFIADYARTYRWGGADAAVFRQLAEQHCGCDLESLFARWVLDP